MHYAKKRQDTYIKDVKLQNPTRANTTKLHVVSKMFIKEHWQIRFRKMEFPELVQFAVLLFEGYENLEYKYQIGDLIAEELTKRGLKTDRIKGEIPIETHFFERYYVEGYKHQWHDPEDETQEFIDHANEVINIKVGKN